VIGKKDALLVLMGFTLFAFAIERVGWTVLLQAIEQARVGLAMILGLSLIRLILQTRSWSIALRSDGIESHGAELMFIRLASQGIGYLSVLGPAASEPMKIRLLRRSGGEQSTVAAATLVDTGVYWFVSALVGIAGCMAAALLLAQSRRSLVPVAIVGLTLAVTLYLIARPTSRLSPLVKTFGDRCPGWLEKARRVEIALREFARRHPSTIRKMLLLDTACQLLLLAEIVAFFYCLKIPLRVTTVLGVEGVTRGIKILAGWMPARIGADESGVTGAFLAFGLSPASGFTLALARRVRDFLAALIGLTWLASSAHSHKIAVQTSKTSYLLKEPPTCKLY